VYDRSPRTEDVQANVIDRLREQIQQRLDQLVGEADRLGKALAALDPRSSSTAATKPAARTAPARKRARPATPKPKTPATKRTPAQPTARSKPVQSTAPASTRTAPGATKASVLAALAGGEAMTAGQVADKTGITRGTVSTTLSKLAKSGEVQKAERGYRLAPTQPAPAATPTASGE
jgi:hypothetical protein